MSCGLLPEFPTTFLLFMFLPPPCQHPPNFVPVLTEVNPAILSPSFHQWMPKLLHLKQNPPQHTLPLPPPTLLPKLVHLCNLMPPASGNSHPIKQPHIYCPSICPHCRPQDTQFPFAYLPFLAHAFAQECSKPAPDFLATINTFWTPPLPPLIKIAGQSLLPKILKPNELSCGGTEGDNFCCHDNNWSQSCKTAMLYGGPCGPATQTILNCPDNPRCPDNLYSFVSYLRDCRHGQQTNPQLHRHKESFCLTPTSTYIPAHCFHTN